MGWSATAEREMREHEDRIEELVSQIHRLQRQRGRLKAKLLDPRNQPQIVIDSFERSQEIACAVCTRDHKATIGPELFIASDQDPKIVCWACGMELAPESAAEVFAGRANDLDQRAMDFLTDVAKHLRSGSYMGAPGAAERIAFVETRCEALRGELRKLKSGGYADPQTWL